MTRVVVYIDYKSPYAFLAKDPIYALEAEAGVPFDWRPYTLDIPSFLGRAEVDAGGRVVVDERSPHQWRRARYAYMDCRRQAAKQGLTLRATRKVWDSSLASIGMLWARRQGAVVLKAYSDRVFERFWKRELDIESLDVIEAVLAEAGAGRGGFREWAPRDGRTEHDALRAEAEAAGVFGVPMLVLDGELYWGREHLPDIRERLLAGGAQAGSGAPGG